MKPYSPSMAKCYCTSRLLTSLMLLVACVFLQSSAWADSLGHSSSAHGADDALFSPELTIDHADSSLTLALTGQAVRKKFVFDIYELAHYREVQQSPATTAEQAKEIFQDILSGGSAQQISMVFRRDLKAKQIQKALAKGVKNNCKNGEYESVKPDLELFRNAINQDVKKHDRFTLRWLPDGRLVSIYQGEAISDIQNPMLARLLWSMWFGEEAVVNRKALVEHLPGKT